MEKLIFFISVSLFILLSSFIKEHNPFLDENAKAENNFLLIFYFYVIIVILLCLYK